MKIFLLMTAVIVVIFIGSVQEGMAKAISSPEQSGASITANQVSPEQSKVFQQIEVLKAKEYASATFFGNTLYRALAFASAVCVFAAMILHRRKRQRTNLVGRAQLLYRTFHGHRVAHRH